MWVIPVNQHGSSNQFALKPYKQSCYLTCVQPSGKIILREGGKGEQEKHATLRFKYSSS